MKRITSLFLVFSLLLAAFLLCSCGTTQECEYDSFISALKKEATVTACVYGDEEVYYEVKVTDEFCRLFDGEFEKSGFNSTKKLLSVTVSMQYELCLFEDDCAMIYYGFCGVFDSDRQYYTAKLDGGIDALTEYIINNGTVIEQKD